MKSPAKAGLFFVLRRRLLELRLFIGHMLARDGIVLLDLHLVGHGPLVLSRRVEVAGAGRRLELDLFTHRWLLRPSRRARASRRAPRPGPSCRSGAGPPT